MRVTVTAAHDEADLREAAQTLAEVAYMDEFERALREYVAARDRRPARV